MIGQLVLRFIVAGLGVSAFAVAGQGLKPDSFAGLFGAAPAVAAVSLAFAARERPPREFATECAAMCLGAIALTAYSIVCAQFIRLARLPVWLSAGLSWSIWIIVAISLSLGFAA